MSKYGSSYQGNDFLEWWKHHYGVDYDGVSRITKSGSMTDEDVAIGRTLYNTYTQQQYLKGQYDQAVTDTNKAYNDLMDTTRNQYDSQIAGAQTEYDTNSKNLLENYNRNSATAKDIYDRSTAELLENYGTAQSALDKNKRQSQQNASITLDKLKKYLPTQVKAQGLGGLGVSESTMLQAYNNYNSDMGAIESDYQDRKSDLETNYNTSKNSYDTSYQETQGRLDEAYGSGQANLDNTFAARKGSLEAAKSSAVDTLAQQLANTLSTLKQNYDKGVFDAARDENGNLLVDNVLKEYAARLSEEQGINYTTALEAIRQAVYTTSGEMSSFVEQYRGKVNDEQFNALMQEGANRVNVNVTASQDDAYKNALGAIEASKYSSQSDMNAFIEQFRGKVSESQFNSLLQTGKGVVATNAKIEQDKENDRIAGEQYNSYQTALENIGSSHYTNQADMDAYIEQFRGKVSESQLNDLFLRGQTVVKANAKAAEDDRLAKEEEVRKGQYATESGNLEVMFQQMIGDDGKISQAEYDSLSAYVNEKGTPLGSYKSLLESQLNGYKSSVRSQSEQAALDKQIALKTPSVRNDIVIDGKLNSANDDAGDNFKIKYNGTSYKVEKGYDASDNLNRKLVDAYTSSTGTTPAQGAVMLYDGRIYMYLENNDTNRDVWCVVQQRKNTYASHFKNLCNALGLTVYSRNYKDSE